MLQQVNIKKGIPMKNNPRTDSNLKVAFQSCAAYFAAFTGTNPAAALFAVDHLYTKTKLSFNDLQRRLHTLS